MELTTLLPGLVRTLWTLADLVLPSSCGGCGALSSVDGVCPACAVILRGPPAVVRPRPAPDGLPTCLAAAAYEGPAREAVLAYKERGQRRLAAPLGDILAGVVQSGLSGVEPDTPLVVVPVPASAAAVRARHGDHMLALARRAVERLRAEGWRATNLETPLRARSRADSAHLDRQARAESAAGAFTLRPAAGLALRARCADAIVVVVDDVLTTGATLASVSRVLTAAGAPVAFAATIAATRLRGVDPPEPYESWETSPRTTYPGGTPISRWG